MLGFEGALYQTEKKLYIHKELGAVKRSLYAWVPALSLGADITAVFYPMPRLGIFCNIAARFLPASAMQNGSKYYSNDYTRHETYTTYGHGAFSAAPSVGALWRW